MCAALQRKQQDKQRKQLGRQRKQRKQQAKATPKQQGQAAGQAAGQAEEAAGSSRASSCHRRPPHMSVAVRCASYVRRSGTIMKPTPPATASTSTSLLHAENTPMPPHRNVTAV